MAKVMRSLEAGTAYRKLAQLTALAGSIK